MFCRKVGFIVLVFLIPLFLSACGGAASSPVGGPPNEVRTALDEKFKELSSMYSSPQYIPDWKIVSAQKAISNLYEWDEIWCVVVDPPFWSGDSVNAPDRIFSVRRDELRWQVDREVIETGFSQLGCTNWPTS